MLEKVSRRVTETTKEGLLGKAAIDWTAGFQWPKTETSIAVRAVCRPTLHRQRLEHKAFFRAITYF